MRSLTDMATRSIPIFFRLIGLDIKGVVWLVNENKEVSEHRERKEK